MKIKWDLPPGVQTLRVNDYDMAYVEQGSGAVVLLVHGSVTDYRYFSAVLGPVAARYRAIAVSLRHYYPEPWEGTGEFSLRQQVADLIAFMEKLDAGPVHLVGHSRGGSAALYVARAAPQLLRTLTLSEPGAEMRALAPPGRGGVEERAVIHRAVAEKLAHGDVDGAAEVFVEFVSGSGTWKSSPDTYRQWLRDNVRTLLGAQRDNWETFTYEDVRRIELPVLLIGAENSPPSFATILDGIERSLTRVERKLIRNSGHSVPLRQPAAYAEAIMEFIDQH
jgi:pimeloyl-ACP methyl ester carboxylesterase